MGVAAIRKNDDGEVDPRSTLRQAIAAAAAVHAKADRQLDVIRRAKDLVATAERRVSEAAEALEGTKGQHVEELAAAVQAGSTPKSNATLRASRASLSDRTDELEAAKAALDRLEADGDDLDASSSQLENAVLVAVSHVVAPIAERLLDQFQRHLIALEVLKGAFLALTDDIDPVDILFNRDIERLNAKDQRLAPIKELRDRFFSLDSKAVRLHAQETVALWQRWRAALRSDPDAVEPNGGLS